MILRPGPYKPPITRQHPPFLAIVIACLPLSYPRSVLMHQSGWTQVPMDSPTHGIKNFKNAYWNLTTAELYEHTVKRGEGVIAHLGPLVVSTGQHTGRSPNDKFVVREPSSEGHVCGQGKSAFEQRRFDSPASARGRLPAGSGCLRSGCFAGADPKYRVPNPRHLGACLAQPLRSQHVCPFRIMTHRHRTIFRIHCNQCRQL